MFSYVSNVLLALMLFGTSVIFGSLFSVGQVEARIEAQASQAEGEVKDPNWTDIAQSDLVYLETSEGLVVIQLTDTIAPKHVENFTNLVTEGFYNNTSFYRVLEGFVAQAGNPSQADSKNTVDAEFTQTASEAVSQFQLIEKEEFLAQSTGYIGGFPAGREGNEEWLLHCPTTVAMARSNDANSASTEFYVVLGHAPRHLDRNMSVFGRVVYGFEHLQSLPRGLAGADGAMQNGEKAGIILSAELGSQRDKKKQLALQVQNTQEQGFLNRLSSARVKDNPFYIYKGNGRLDVCYYRPATRIKP